MGIQDRDWYRDHYAKKRNASGNNSLANIVDRTEKRRRKSKLVVALVWIGVTAALYYTFTVAGHFAH